jgi:hypothetical protein
MDRSPSFAAYGIVYALGKVIADWNTILATHFERRRRDDA